MVGEVEIGHADFAVGVRQGKAFGAQGGHGVGIGLARIGNLTGGFGNHRQHQGRLNPEPRIVRVQRDGAGIGFPGLGGMAQFPERIGQPSMGGSKVLAANLGRVNRAAVVFYRPVKIVEPFAGPGQRMVGLDEIRFQARRFPINVYRLVGMAGAVQDTTEIVIRKRIIGLRQHRPAQGLQRVVQLVQTIEHKTHFHPGVGIPGIQCDGLAVGRDRALVVALAHQFPAETKMITGKTVVRSQPQRRGCGLRPLFLLFRLTAAFPAVHGGPWISQRGVWGKD